MLCTGLAKDALAAFLTAWQDTCHGQEASSASETPASTDPVTQTHLAWPPLSTAASCTTRLVCPGVSLGVALFNTFIH